MLYPSAQAKKVHFIWCWIIILLFFSSRGLTANSPDTLIQVDTALLSEFQLIDHYNDRAYGFRRRYPDSLYYYARLALEKSEALQYERGLTFAHKNIGIYRYKQGRSADSIIASYQRAQYYAIQTDDYYNQAALANNIALVRNQQGRYTESTGLMLEALNALRANDQQFTRLEGLINANLAANYRRIGQLEKSKAYLEQCFAIAEQINEPSLIGIYSNDYGGVLIAMGEKEKGAQFLLDQIKLLTESGDYQSIIHCKAELATYFFQEEDYVTSESYAEDGYQIAIEHNFTALEARLQILLAQARFGQARYEAALASAQEGLRAALISSKPIYQEQAYGLLGRIYAQQAQFDTAFFYQALSLELQDSIHGARQTMIARELEANSKLFEQEQRIEYLKERQINQRRLISVLVITCLLGAGLVGALFYSRYRGQHNQRIIEEKNAELKQYIEQNLELENFAHIASHDLKTPLRNITSFAQLLDRRLENAPPEKLREYLHFISKGSQEMSVLLDDLLAFSLLNRQQLQLQTIQFNKMVTDLLASLQTTIKASNAVVNVQLDTRTMVGDPVKLRQLLQNLILNGIKFRCPSVDPIIDIQLVTETDAWVLSVSDNGIGIKEEFQEQIFLIFQRLHTKVEYEGTGIGLAICKQIAEQHGGQISVQSIEEEGSTFIVRLPKRTI